MSVTQISAQTQLFLHSCNADELNTMINIIQSRQNMLLSSARQAKSAGNRIAKRIKEPASHLITPAKRPLNSFIAFRGYYGPIFTSAQQKDISGHLKKLWKDDPFKAKWTLLAKAYSIIRDHRGKHIAPLNVFLDITCPHIGIIAPDEYLLLMGWDFVNVDGVKQLTQSFHPDVSEFPLHNTTTNLSVQDVITFCVQHGFIDQGIPQLSYSTSSMTFTAKPGNPQLRNLNPFSPSDNSDETSYQSSVPTPIIASPTSPGYNFPAALSSAESPLFVPSYKPDNMNDNSEHSSNTHFAHSTQQATNNLGSGSAALNTHFQYPTQTAAMTSGQMQEGATVTQYSNQLIPDRGDMPILNPLDGDHFDAFDASGFSTFSEFVPGYESFDTPPFFGDDFLILQSPGLGSAELWMQEQ